MGNIGIAAGLGIGPILGVAQNWNKLKSAVAGNPGRMGSVWIYRKPWAEVLRSPGIRSTSSQSLLRIHKKSVGPNISLTADRHFATPVQASRLHYA